MTVHAKLMQARVKLNNSSLKKSGENKFAGYKYFELGDFLPQTQDIFKELNLCGIVSFAHDIATLTITDIDDGTVVTITSPMSTAALKGCHEVQNLGAVQTYIRRYLWVAAMEIVEHDALDSSEGVKEEPKAKPAARPAPRPPAKIEGTEGNWQVKIDADREADQNLWLETVMSAFRLALQTAGNQKDLMEIFTVNRNIFDALKQCSPEDYEALLAEFTKRKQELKDK